MYLIKVYTVEHFIRRSWTGCGSKFSNSNYSSDSGSGCVQTNTARSPERLQLHTTNIRDGIAPGSQCSNDLIGRKRNLTSFTPSSIKGSVHCIRPRLFSSTKNVIGLFKQEYVRYYLIHKGQDLGQLQTKPKLVTTRENFHP